MPRPDHKAVWLRFYEASVRAAGPLGYREMPGFPAGWEAGNQAYQGALWRWASEDEMRVLTPYYIPSARQLTFLLDRYFEVSREDFEHSLRSNPGFWPECLLAAPQLRRQMGPLGFQIKPWHLFWAPLLKFDKQTGKPERLDGTLARMLRDLPVFERETGRIARSEARALHRPDS